jgi:wobble nucleotide-excising tRNase
LNQSDNEVIEEFIIEPNIETMEITFKAKILGRDVLVDAVSFLSTGHLRCLGFALLVARAQIRGNEVKFIAIDDPIYSVDHEHRYFLIKYLKKLANKYQLIITTSDRLFYDLIRHQFSATSFKAYRTYFGNYSAPDSCKETVLGVEIKETFPNYIREAKNHLNAGDLRAASLYARLALETILFEVAKTTNIKIPFKRISKVGHKDLIDAGIKESLKRAYSERAEDIEKEFQKLSNHRYFRSILKGFPPDQELHFPHERRDIYTKQEIEEVIASLETFVEFLNEVMES